MMKNIIILSIAFFLLASCDKEAANFHKFAGIYKVYKYEMEYYSSGNLDSVLVKEDIGTIGLLDNSHYQYNILESNLTYTPLLWQYYGVGTPNYWYLDEYNAETLTLWMPQYIGTTFIIYTREKTSGKRERWIAVTTDANGEIKQKEIIYVKQEK